MTKTCMFCKGEHELKECPHFADTKTYLREFAPRHDTPPPARKRASLAPTQFEQVFGAEAETLLQDVLDHPQDFGNDEVNLAWQILGGMKKLKDLNQDERDLLDHITHRMIGGKYTKPQTETVRQRHPEDDEGPPVDEDIELVTKGQVDPSDG